MSFIPVANGCKLETIFVVGTQRLENVYWFKKSGGGAFSAADVANVAGAYWNWESFTSRLLRSNQVTNVLNVAKATDSLGAPYYEQVSNLVGNVNATVFPSPISIAIRHTTGLSGRSYRGRTYWIGAYNSIQFTPDTITTAYAASLATNYNTFRTHMLTAGFVWCVASLYSGVTIVGGRRRAIPRAAGILTPIINSSCGVGFDTQRHRKATQI